MRRARPTARSRRPTSSELVLMSITSDPGAISVSASPTTASTCGGPGRLVTSTSAPARQSASEEAGRAPVSDAVVHRGGLQVKGRHGVTGRAEMAAHVRPHVAEADKGDPPAATHGDTV